MLGYAPNNSSGQRVVTEKWLLENKNYPQDLKIKLGPIHKLKGTINSD
jgi:hypothetical protein